MFFGIGGLRSQPHGLSSRAAGVLASLLAALLLHRKRLSLLTFSVASAPHSCFRNRGFR